MTAATVLAAHAELHGSRRSFAVQELLDCVPNPLRCGGQGGCQGATVELAMSYAMHLGLAEATARPYGRPQGCGEQLIALEVSTQQGEALDRVNQSQAQRSEDHAALRFLHQRRVESKEFTASKRGFGLRIPSKGAAYHALLEPLSLAQDCRGPC